MKRSRIGWLLLFLLLFALLGYFREFFFVNLNVIMFMRYYGTEPSLPIPDVMMTFTRYSYEQLYYGKYFFTAAWALLFYLLNLITIRKLSAHPLSLRILNYSYLAIVLLSALSMLFAWFVKEKLDSDEYTLSRWLMGIAQSPIICLILLASEKLYKTSRNP
jgi:hypothetical protein